MTGKVFEGSSSIHEDQARVLFEHFRQAAEAIVGEEERLEKEMASTKEFVAQLEAQEKKLGLQEKIAYAAAVVVGIGLAAAAGPGAGVLGLGPLAYGLFCLKKRKDAARQIEEARKKTIALATAHKEIRRDYKVHRVGVAYVPVAARIPFEGGQFLIDYTESAPRKEFKLSTVKQGELFTSAVTGLQELLTDVPLVEASSEVEKVPTDQYSPSIQDLPMYDYLGKLDRSLRATAFCLEDLETHAVSLPVIFPNEASARFLDEYGQSSAADQVTIPVFDAKRYDGELAAFKSLNEMKKALEQQSGQFENVLRGLMVDVAGAVQALTSLKMASTSKLVERSNKLFFQVLKASYNHYSPRLEAEEIERIRSESFDYQESVDNDVPFQLKASSRVLYDPVGEVWLAEDGSKTSFPFGISQIHEEIVAPMVLSLMKENRLERLKIYNGIKDQKISYLNKWHQDTEDFYGRNRAESADLINLMRSSFTEFMANYNTFQSLEQTEAQMSKSGSLGDTKVTAVQDASGLAAMYDAKRRDYQAVQDDFHAYMERLKEDIDRRAERFGFIEYFEASMRDGEARNVSQAAARSNELDARRRPLLAVNPHYAEASELPPPPTVTEQAGVDSALNLRAVARNALAELDVPEVR